MFCFLEEGSIERERREEDEKGGEETIENLKIIEIVFTCNLSFWVNYSNDHQIYTQFIF